MKTLSRRVVRIGRHPFGHRYYGLNLFGIILATQELTPQQLNHEWIHTVQQRELAYVGFYLLYAAEWVAGFIRHRSTHEAYLSVSFEREAYAHQHDLLYLRSRPHYAFRHF